VIDPVPAGVIVQVTDVFEEPVTLAVNCCVWLANRLLLTGVTVTLTGGLSVTAAVADWVVSAALVAFTVTVCAVAMDAGAV
jgi:hypothetical protein